MASKLPILINIKHFSLSRIFRANNFQNSNDSKLNFLYHQSKFYAQRSEKEKNVLKDYYNRLEVAVKTGGVDQPSDVIDTFSQDQQKIIHKFLQDTGVKPSDINFD